MFVNLKRPPYKKKIEQYFNNEYDARKTSKGVPIRYALGNYSTLQQKFTSIEENCSYQTFIHAIPHYVRKPSAWDTCFCATCLNPELKLESLAYKNILKKVDLAEVVNNEI